MSEWKEKRGGGRESKQYCCRFFSIVPSLPLPIFLFPLFSSTLPPILPLFFSHTVGKPKAQVISSCCAAIKNNDTDTPQCHDEWSLISYHSSHFCSHVNMPKLIVLQLFEYS